MEKLSGDLSKSKRVALNKRFPFLRAWGVISGSFDYYIVLQQLKAEEQNAPGSTIYFDQKDQPVLWESIEKETTKIAVFRKACKTLENAHNSKG